MSNGPQDEHTASSGRASEGTTSGARLLTTELPRCSCPLSEAVGVVTAAGGPGGTSVRSTDRSEAKERRGVVEAELAPGLAVAIF